MSKNIYLNSTEELIKHINGDLPNDSQRKEARRLLLLADQTGTI